MNLLVLSGRLTHDAEMRYTTDGKAVVTFNFAVNRTFDKENADFFKCIGFGKVAENMEKLNIQKGTKLLLEGEIRNNNYTDKNGVKRYEMQVIVNSFEFCESKASGTAAPQTPPQTNSDGFMSIPDGIDEELPFN